jgi:type IV secretory pathway TrbL component
VVISAFSIVTGILPFSLAEMLVIFLAFIIVWKLVWMLVILLKMKKLNQSILFNYLVNLLAFVSIVYFAFILLWGLNYNRISFANIAHFTIQPATTEDLADVCNNLINQTNRLRMRLDEDFRRKSPYT